MTSQRVWNNWEVCNTPEWQPIETAPKDETRILVTDGGEAATAEFTNGRWILSPIAQDYDGALSDLPFEPTHWMPLPEPPASR